MGDQVRAHTAEVLLVVVGGAIGSGMRYAVGRALGPTAGATVPWHTFAVNVTGAFALGFMLVAAARCGWPGWWRPFLGVGLLGGYTTFSAYSLEVAELAMHGAWATGVAYALGSVAAGVLGAACGIWLGRATL